MTTSLAPLCAVVIWAGNTIVTKAASVAIQPASIVFYRWLLAFALLSLFNGKGIWRNRHVVAQHWSKLMVLGVLGMAVYQGLAYQAALSMSAINMGVLVSLAPLMSALLSSAIAREAVPVRTLVGALLSLTGLVWLTSQGHPASLFQQSLQPGDGLMLIAIFANSLYGLLLKRWAVPLSTWQQLHVQVGFGVLVTLPIWLASPISPITVNNAPLILYAGVAASIGAPFFWMKGVHSLGAPRASLYLNLLPVLVAGVACVVLGEQLHSYHAVGGALALMGVAVGLQKKIANGRPRGTALTCSRSLPMDPRH
ncbi:DMT family transporter [Pseudomonas sp. RIT-To-2]|uniref:DMT family transporter n=1 Tax=Pseudomonas sp. RIT-To-2 TaxID=3462541 RepID=UPI0024135895